MKKRFCDICDRLVEDYQDNFSFARSEQIYDPEWDGSERRVFITLRYYTGESWEPVDFCRTCFVHALRGFADANEEPELDFTEEATR